MYSVSEDYITQLKSPIQERKLSGTIGGLSFTSDDVLAGSFSIDSKCMPTKDIKYGSVEITSLSITFFKDFADQIQRQTYQGLVIEPVVSLKVGEEWEDVPCGVFTVDEALWNEVGVAIKAYDNMSKLDKNITLDTSYGKAYDLLALACETCGITLGVTRAEIEAMPNGTEQFAIYPENDIETWRDMVYWVAQTLAGFATCDRAGNLVVRQFGNDTEIELGTNHRFTGITISDYITNYTGVSCVNMYDDSLTYIGATVDTGLTMNLGSNPLLQDQQQLKETRMRNILNELLTFQYTPFKCKMIGDIAFDLGDVIHYTGGVADNSDCCIMSYSYVFGKDYTAQGFGENPALATAKSKVDKNLAEIKSRTRSNVLEMRKFVNAEEFTIGDGEEQTIISISFTTIDATNVSFFSEIQLQCSDEDMSVEVTYHLDLEEVTYHPNENWKTSGLHLLNLMYFAEVDANRVYTWTVSLKPTGGSLYIGINKARACISGQGLAAVEKWNGRLGFAEEIAFLNVPSSISSLLAFTETISASTQTPVGATLSEGVGFIAIDGNIIPLMDMTESVSFKKHVSTYTWNEIYSYTWNTLYEYFDWGDLIEGEEE